MILEAMAYQDFLEEQEEAREKARREAIFNTNVDRINMLETTERVRVNLEREQQARSDL